MIPQQFTIISLQVDKECTGDDPIVYTGACTFTSSENSPDISARAAAFYNSGNVSNSDAKYSIYYVSATGFGLQAVFASVAVLLHSEHSL